MLMNIGKFIGSFMGFGTDTQCNGVLLSDLQTQHITDTIKEQAKSKYDTILGANMEPGTVYKACFRQLTCQF